MTNWCIECAGCAAPGRAVRRMRPVQHAVPRSTTQSVNSTGSPWLLARSELTVHGHDPLALFMYCHPNRSRSQVNGLHRPSALVPFFSRYDIRQPNDVIRLGDCINWFYLCCREDLQIEFGPCIGSFTRCVSCCRRKDSQFCYSRVPFDTNSMPSVTFDESFFVAFCKLIPDLEFRVQRTSAEYISNHGLIRVFMKRDWMRAAQASAPNVRSDFQCVLIIVFGGNTSLFVVSL